LLTLPSTMEKNTVDATTDSGALPSRREVPVEKRKASTLSLSRGSPPPKVRGGGKELRLGLKGVIETREGRYSSIKRKGAFQ